MIYMDSKKRPGVGVGIMILNGNKVLLGHRNPDPEKADSQLHGEGTWTMPGGKLHFGESLEEAAIREVEEETGMKLEKKSLRFISLSNDFVKDAHFITIGFLCEEFEGKPKATEPDEITEWKWFSLNSLPSPMFLASEKLINNFKDGKIYKGD